MTISFNFNFCMLYLTYILTEQPVCTPIKANKEIISFFLYKRIRYKI